jgi:hypothetical protein
MNTTISTSPNTPSASLATAQAPRFLPVDPGKPI